eukprot:1005591-Amphidinium_carterae.1
MCRKVPIILGPPIPLWGLHSEKAEEAQCDTRELQNVSSAASAPARNDIRKLTELVVTKTSMYTMVATLILAVNIALFCAGRLGLHGQAPPGWIM